MSIRALTPSAVIEAHNKALEVHKTETGKFNSFNYCIGYAVSAVFRISYRSKNENHLAKRKKAIQAVQLYSRTGILPKVEPKEPKTKTKKDTSLSDITGMSNEQLTFDMFLMARAAHEHVCPIQ